MEAYNNYVSLFAVGHLVEITKKLYGDDQGFAELIDASGNIQQANIIYDTDAFRTDLGGQGVTFLSAPNGTLPPGTIVLQRKICQDKDGKRCPELNL